MIKPYVLAAWHEFSEPFEGRVHWMYLDVFGLVTTAVGVLIDSPAGAASLPWVRADGLVLATDAEIEAEWHRVKSMPPGLHFRQYRGSLRMTDDAINYIVMSRLHNNARRIARQLPDFPTWPADAQLGALSRAWAAGADLAKWPKHRAACERRDWIEAGRESVLRHGLDTPQTSDDNPGVVPRNEAQLVAFRNAAIVERDRLDPARLWWPRDLADEPQDTVPSPPNWHAAFRPIAGALQFIARFFR